MPHPAADPAPAAPAPSPAPPAAVRRVALLGNPNTGKTTLFNRLCGLRHKTSNFPGTTLDARVGRLRLGGAEAELIDLPGVYSLELAQHEAAVCRAVLAGETAPKGEPVGAPDAACVVVDAANLARNLAMVGEALRRRLPTVVALNMMDVARRRGLALDPPGLEAALGCPVVAISARSGAGVDALLEALASPRIATTTPPNDEPGLRRWADEIYTRAVKPAPGSQRGDTFSDRVDRAFTHPLLGGVVFALVMAGMFWALFRVATYPMAWIESLFAYAGGAAGAVLPDGALRDLLVDGVIAGVGSTLVFLPQICLLFFLFSLLEDTGYLARAAFVVDRLLRPFGLPGQAFVPLLSSHACALPGIMAARAIPDRRERLATILVAPFMTCSARLPVYVLLITLLFGDRPALAAVAFVGCYALGMLAGVGSALLFRRTILRGEGRPMALELPSYKWPSVRSAVVAAWDRGRVFLRKAGSVILAISIVLWWLSAYPASPPPAESIALRNQAALVASGNPQEADALRARADAAEASNTVRHSFAGRIGRAIEPAFAPLGYDWQVSIGVMTSFAAREVFVATMGVVFAGADDAEGPRLLHAVREAKRDDGATPVFTRATCWSLLVFYVLAMQCLPTLVVTAREAGALRWAVLQLVWMTGVAYAAAFVVFHALRAAGVA